jgi:hypothetical protein
LLILGFESNAFEAEFHDIGALDGIEINAINCDRSFSAPSPRRVRAKSGSPMAGRRGFCAGPN